MKVRGSSAHGPTTAIRRRAGRPSPSSGSAVPASRRTTDRSAISRASARLEGESRVAIGVGNGTDALWLVLMAMGVGEGDEVITNANTFFATAEAIWVAGATAVLVDCDDKTPCIDPAAIRKAITKRTKAI